MLNQNKSCETQSEIFCLIRVKSKTCEKRTYKNKSRCTLLCVPCVINFSINVQ